MIWIISENCYSIIAGKVRESYVGKRIVLLVIFIGGPRDMQHRYYDAMTLVQWFGPMKLQMS